MKFTFAEVELINSCFENEKVKITKKEYIDRLIEAKNNTDNSTLIEIADNLINKLNKVDEIIFSKIIQDLPVDVFTNY